MAKGITSEVGAFLALMLLITLSTGTYFWASRVQNAQENSVTGMQTAFFTKVIGPCVSISGFSHNTFTNKSTVTLRNCGSTSIDVGDAAADDSVLSSGPPQCSFVLSRDNCDICSFALAQNELKTFKINWDVMDCQIVGNEEKELLFRFDGSVAAGIRFTPLVTGSCNELKREITINNTGNRLDGYQVNLTINTSAMIAEGNMSVDCSDMRFKDTNDKDDLPFWIESGCNTTTTKIWVNVPQMPSGEKRIFMHHKNTGAVNLSNGTDTFIVFDDFTGTAIDYNLWNLSLGGTTATTEVKDGVINMFANNSYTWLTSKVNFTTNTSLEIRMFAVNSSEERDRIRVGTTSGMTVPSDLSKLLADDPVGAPQQFQIQWLNGIWTGISIPEREYFRWIESYNDTALQWNLDSETSPFYYANSSTITDVSTRMNTTILVGEQLSLIKGGNITIDWISVRRRLLPEPVMASVGPEIPVCTE